MCAERKRTIEGGDDRLDSAPHTWIEAANLSPRKGAIPVGTDRARLSITAASTSGQLPEHGDLFTRSVKTDLIAPEIGLEMFEPQEAIAIRVLQRS